jgi:lauroyl/myristoyl acyltransferase
VLWSGGRRRCIQNMRHVTGGDERAARRYARESFGNYLVTLVDFFRLLSTLREETLARVRSADWERVAEARHGRGVIVVTMHFGLWDVGAAILALHGIPVAAIADRFPNKAINDYVVSSREHLGMWIIAADRMGPGLIRALRNDDAIAILADIPAPSGVRVTFFGDTIAVPDTPARLALRTGASVVAATVPRVSRWGDAVRAEAASIEVVRTGDDDADAQTLMQALFAHFEGVVRRDPAQWYIFRNLWLSDAADSGPGTGIALGAIRTGA